MKSSNGIKFRANRRSHICKESKRAQKLGELISWYVKLLELIWMAQLDIDIFSSKMAVKFYSQNAF